MVNDDSLSQTGCQRQTPSELTWTASLAGLGDSDATARLEAWSHRTVAWVVILAEARHLRLAPLVYAGLCAVPALRARIPPDAWEALRRLTCLAAIRATLLERVGGEVVAAAAAAGVPVLVLKGPALGALVYPPEVARPMDDVDLLVAPENWNRLAEILWSQGYRNDRRGTEDFLPVIGSHSIDVHTGLLNATRLPARGRLWPVTFDEMWAESQPFLLGGVLARTLGPRHTLYHLGIHAVHHHGLEGGLWMVDLLACLRAWPNALSEVASALPPVRRSLWYCLEILSCHAQDPAPDVRDALRPRRILPWERWVLTVRGVRDLPEGIRYALTFTCLPHWREKVAFLRQLLFPPADVYTKGFADGEDRVPRWREHARMAGRLGTSGLRDVVSGYLQGRYSSARQNQPLRHGSSHLMM